MIGWFLVSYLIVAPRAQGSTWRPDVPENCFRGAASPGEYLIPLISQPEPWDRAQRAFFIERAIESWSYMDGRLNYVIDFSPQEIAKLERLFPELRGHLSEPTAGYIGYLIQKAHPDARRQVAVFRDRGDRFLGLYASPTRYLEISDLGVQSRPLTAREWRHADRVLRFGAAWERKHPDCDFGLSTNDRFIHRMRNRFPGYRFERSRTGYRVTALWKAVQERGIIHPSRP